MNSNTSITLRVPGEIASLVKRGCFPEDPENPLVVFEFLGGHESLFDTRKGLFLTPPEGVELPPKESLKAFGKVIESFRSQRRESKLDTSGSSGPQIGEFAICS